MQTTTTTTIEIPAGTSVRGGAFNFTRAQRTFRVEAEEVRGKIVDGGGKVIVQGVIGYTFSRGKGEYETVYTVDAREVRVVTPEPPTSPESTTAPKHTTTTTKRVSRQSKEARRNAKAELAYRSMRDLGSIDPRNTALEGFSVPSLSEPGVTRTVAHDMASDRYHCDCTHGQHGGRGECYHILAARRRVDERRAQWQAAYERDTRAGGYGYNDTLNLMFGTQAASGY